MAPIVASTAGVARQTIDDPELIALLERLSSFDPTSGSGGTHGSTAGSAASKSTIGGAKGDVSKGAETGAASGDGDAVMADATDADSDWVQVSPDQPPLDVEALAAELEKYPRWRFQEQADLHEWIRPLNAMDAALDYLMDAHPSLLLLPREKKKTAWGKGSNEGGSDMGDEKKGGDEAAKEETSEEQSATGKETDDEPPAPAVRQVIALLTFQCALLKNATSKSLYRSTSHLSSLLASSSDAISHLAVEALAALAAPPALHKQQAPEGGRHATQLHERGENSEVMWRLTCLSAGWGGRGTGLGLRECAGLDDAALAEAYADDAGGLAETSDTTEVKDGNEGGDGTGGDAPTEDEKKDPDAVEEGTTEEGEDERRALEKERRRLFLRRAGELSFECRCTPSLDEPGAEETKGAPVSIRVPREGLLATEDEEGAKSPAGKRRRTEEGNNVASAPRLKSTARIHRECLAEIRRQLHERRGGETTTNNTTNTDDSEESPANPLPPASQFALLASVRLARAFHTPSTRTALLETRLRALTALIHALSGAGGAARLSAIFGAQPELAGEMADLLKETVSGAHVSGGGLSNEDDNDDRGAALLALGHPPTVPYTLRTLAVEALTALVARRDATTGSLCGVARQTNVLAELGVGKGKHGGLLPSLLRCALAALNSFLLRDAAALKSSLGEGKAEGKTPEEEKKGDATPTSAEEEDVGLALGLAFLRSTRPPSPPASVRLVRGLEFVDAVLTLASAAVGVPGGTAGLTESGAVPALVHAVALDAGRAAVKLECAKAADEGAADRGADKSAAFNEGGEESHADALLQFITAQAIQILEGAVVTHGAALAAFHELDGVEVLVKRLSAEMDAIKWLSEREDEATADESAEGEAAATKKPPRHLQAARRVLLFSAVNCLTVVFHPPSAGGTADPRAPSPGATLRRSEVHSLLTEILDRPADYGGVLAALASTFLSDVMNADPQVVRFVHSSGLAASFLGLLRGPEKFDARPESYGAPAIAPSAELLMAVPNVLSALALTEDGATAIETANPFPALLAVFCSPQYAMPESRCLLNELAAIVGTGMDELMRHTPSLKTVVITAVVGVMERVAHLGKELVAAEDAAVTNTNCDDARESDADLEVRRTQLAQYVHNVGQLLEQILHADDHVAPFVGAGGYDALLELVRYAVVPGGRGLVAQLSCASGAAGGTVSSAGRTLEGLAKTVMSHTSEPHALLQKLVSQLESQLSHHDALAAARPLTDAPSVPLHELACSPANARLVQRLASIFRSTLAVDRLARTLAGSVRAAAARSAELGAAGLLAGRENEWRAEVAGESFGNVVDRFGALYRSALMEVCRVRTAEGFDERDARLRRQPAEGAPVYKLRIVCPEGAIVRNGIDIDRCDSVGSLEVGEVVLAYDRCVNSSGVVRYRTSIGWVSEMTRGHGREAIAEVLDVRSGGGGAPPSMEGEVVEATRGECGIPDLRSVGAVVLARLHGGQASLFASLQRLMISGIRPPPRSSLGSSPVRAEILAAAKMLGANLKANLAYASDGDHDGEGGDAMDEESPSASDASKAMYLGNQLDLLMAALFEEKRDRRQCNVPLLLNLLLADSDGRKDSVYAMANGAGSQRPESTEESSPEAEGGGAIVSAIRFVLMHSLGDFAAKKKAALEQREQGGSPEDDKSSPREVQSRAVASSLPPALSLLRRLMTRQLIIESTTASALAKMKASDFIALVANTSQKKGSDDDDDASSSQFNAAQLARALHLQLAKLSREVWSDDRFPSMPAHAMHPFIGYMSDVLKSLEEASKVIEPQISSAERPNLGGVLGNLPQGSRQGRLLASMGQLGGGLGGALRELAEAQQNAEPFEPSEESISRLAEMGFSRDHAQEALETTGTNRVDVAMEYALTHPPSSPGTLERRRAAREQRRLEQQRQNEERERQEREAAAANEEQERANESNEPAGDAEESQARSDSDTPPDAKEDEETKPKTPTEKELKAQKEKELEEKLAAEAKEYCETIKSSLCKICLDVIEANAPNGVDVIERGDEDTARQSNQQMEDDSKGSIIVVSNFLLDLMRQYPALKTDITTQLLERVRSKLDVQSSSSCRVKSGDECNFAALVHAAVVVTRAEPSSRPFVLQQGLVGMLTHTTSSALRGKEAPAAWPRWLAPVLLLLEVMAQPTTVTLEGVEAGQSKRSELGKVLAEHKKKTAALAKTAKSVFSTVMDKEVGKATPKKKKEAEDAKKQSQEKSEPGDSPAEDDKDDKPKASEQTAPLPPIPTYLPLLPDASSEALGKLCLQLLGGLKLKKGVVDKAHLEQVSPPPSITNAILLLLLRLLHSRQLAASCLSAGGADLILALPDRSTSFPAKNALITLLLRRMLEDEATLHTMMESEIRSVVTKIHRRQHPNASGAGSQPKTNLKNFMQQATPIICRDPAVFLKAMTSSVKIEATGSQSSSLSSSRGSQVLLLSGEERVKARWNLVLHSYETTAADKLGSQEEQPRRGSRRRSKSPQRRASKQSPTKSPKAPKNHQQLKLNGTPANHVTALLLKETVRSAEAPPGSKDPYSTTLDYLGTLSDLVLAIPACGAAVHRFRMPAKDITVHNAVLGCPDPPQTAVSYLLHKLLPQPRELPDEPESGEVSESAKRRKKLAYNQTRLSQATARLMVCLVARSGEGRRRVISDLVFALGCGQSLAGKAPNQPSPDAERSPELGGEDLAMHALLSWSELCTGLASPKGGQESNSSLSVEIIKLMLEAGAPHALMAAIEQIDLEDPMATSVASSLIKPLEIFTRSSVYKSVTEMAEKDTKKAKTRRGTFGPSQRNESSFADDAALDISFDQEEDAGNASDEDDEGSDESMGDDESSTHSAHLDLPRMDIDGSDEEIESEESSDEESSAESDGMEEESDGNESVEGDDEDMSNGDANDEGDWGEENDEAFFEDDEADEATNAIEQVRGRLARPDGDAEEAMEGWTRVDAGAGGRGGILGGLLESLAAQGAGRQQNGGFLLDAAETIMGSVLRGDMGMEGIDAVEDALGIRVVRGDGRGGPAGLARTQSNLSRHLIHQGGSSGVTSAFGARSPESPMEFVYGQSDDSPSPSSPDEDASPSTYDVSLFGPGGVTASTHSSKPQPSLHPLSQSIRLPPITSLRSLSTVATNGESTSGGRSSVSRTVAQMTADGNVIRVTDSSGFHDGPDRLARRSAPNGLSGSGWLDTEAPDRGVEAFSAAFSTFLQDQSNASRAQESNEPEADAGNEDDERAGGDDEAHEEEAEENEAEDAGDEEPEEEVNDEEDGDEPNEGDNPPPNAEDDASNAQPPAAPEPPTDEPPAVPEPQADDAAVPAAAADEGDAPGDVVMAEADALGDGAEGATNDENAEEGAHEDADAVPGDFGEEEENGQDASDVVMAEAGDDAAEEDVQEEAAAEAADGTGEDPPGIEEAPAADDGDEAPAAEPAANQEEQAANQEETANGGDQLVCPPDIDPEVFASLPEEMQREVIREQQETAGGGDQLICPPDMDPEVFASLPDDMRREVIEQEQRQQRLREEQAAQPAADPANAEEMDNASFLASLAPDLRQEILLTADEAFITSLPDALIAEANVLRERVAAQHRRRSEEAAANAAGAGAGGGARAAGGAPAQPAEGNAGASRRRQRNGILKVESDRQQIVYTNEASEKLGPLLTPKSSEAFLRLFYLLTPLQPSQRVMNKLLLNLCHCKASRDFFLGVTTSLLLSDNTTARALLGGLKADPTNDAVDLFRFPPSSLIGVAADLRLEQDGNSRAGFGLRRRQGTDQTVAMATCLPASACGSSLEGKRVIIPPVVGRRLLAFLSSLCKTSPRVAFSMLCHDDGGGSQTTCFDKLIDLMGNEQFSQSASSLEQLLSVLEIVVAPLSLLPKDGQEPPESELQTSGGRESVRVPRVALSQRRLHLLVNALRLESCKDTSFLKVNTVARRLSRVEANRTLLLRELALVAEGLGKAATRDLKAVGVRLRVASASKQYRDKAQGGGDGGPTQSSAVALATSNAELKLLRVLQMLNSLCVQDDESRGEGNSEFISFLQSLHLDSFFDELNSCLQTTAKLEGVAIAAEDDENDGEDNNDEAADGDDKKKLQTSSSQLITRFLPAIEAFFMVNANVPSSGEGTTTEDENSRVVQFAGRNKTLLNALLRSNPSLLEKGLKAMVKMPKCRVFLDFDVKRHWFKAQVRRLRQQASRRHGSFRLNLRRKHVFEDSFHAFIHRNADELRGRLHITFVNEEGVDAGGLSREFFAILAKEMFNPNYALFMSTEDGCTFQPNPNSSINPDDMRYFRFVGRIVGKAVVDGFLLDAHFTRSLYKHMLGEKPKVDDMQAIDPDYYKNLQMILEHNLDDIGLELTMSTEDHSFGGSRTIDLIPDGRTIAVTEETKERYVDLVCQHRMTTAIEKQIKAFLEGFHEMVDTDLISIFTAKELELLISGMPDIDIHDLKKNTDYHGYRPADKEIGWFWNILFALTRSQKASFLQFVTGSSKVPLSGFSELQGMRGVQKFSITKASGPAGALMSAHTCFNALDLPLYKSEEEMKEKLMYAIQEGSGGFGFA
ncbi:hypothetical protein ACHAXT_003729 [Thalassiosira profunda]